MPQPTNRIEDARTYTDFSALDVNTLAKEYYIRVLSGLNNDNTPFTMPISIKADIPDFSNAIQAALNQQSAIASQQAAATSDQANALQNLANQVATAAQSSTGAAQQTAQSILNAAQAQAAQAAQVQQNVFQTLVTQNDTILLELARHSILLAQLLGEEVSATDVETYAITNQ